jgi:hypothetical protein
VECDALVLYPVGAKPAGNCRPSKEITVEQACRMALENFSAVRLIGQSHAETAGRILLASREESCTPEKLRSEIFAKLNDVENRFWDLEKARTILTARLEAQDLGNRVLAAENTRALVFDQAGLNSGNRALIGSRVASRNIATTFAVVREKRAEEALRNAIGLTDADRSALLLRMTDGESPHDSVGNDPTRIATHDKNGAVPAWVRLGYTDRQAGEVDAVSRALHSATTAREAARERLDVLLSQASNGTAAAVKTLDAIDAHELSVVREADRLMQYRLASSRVRHALGTNPITANVVIATSPPVPSRLAAAGAGPKRDAQATPVAFPSQAAEPRVAPPIPLRASDLAGRSGAKGTLDLRVESAPGASDYQSTISLQSIGAEPLRVRIPLADGSVVEIDARLVKPASR